MDTEDQLVLYNLTIKPASSTVKSIIGNFTGNKRQEEVVRVCGSYIELWKLDTETGKLQKLLDQNTFSIIRDVSHFKITGSIQDYLIITSDAGNLSICQFNSETFQFQPVSNEPFFKSGVRRITPGEYIAVDGKGRAVMVGALEKNKLVYTFRREVDNKLVVSSPLEAIKSRIVTFELSGLDVGFENPMFVAIEAEYGSNLESHTLNTYELDLGSNHIVKRHSEELRNSSQLLIPLPGGIDGPSGCLVCSENLIQYKYLSKMTHNIPIPRRDSCLERSSNIICGVVHKVKKSFFILLQNDLGDIFKVSVDYVAQDSNESNGEGGIVNSLEISYFDSMPICTSLIIFKSGFLYANCESGDQYIYQFEKLGDSERVWNSTNYPDDIAALSETPDELAFEVKPFDNLALVDIVEFINPIVSSDLYDSGNASDLPVIVSASGTGSRSSLKFLKHELPITEVVSSELPAVAQRVFTAKLTRDDVYDQYIILSFVDATLALLVGETVEEVDASISGFDSEIPTIDVAQIGQASVVQIHPNGIRQIFYNSEARKMKKVVEWFPPAGIKILHSTCTNSQVAIALSNREIIYFEANDADELIQYSEAKEMNAQITSISMGEIPKGKIRFPFLVIGCSDKSLTVLSTDPMSVLETINEQSLSAFASSLLVMGMNDRVVNLNMKTRTEDEDIDSIITTSLYLHVGMNNGVYARLSMDIVTGALSNPRNKYTGPKEVKLSPLLLSKQNVVSVLSTRTYLGYMSISNFKLTPLSEPVFKYVCSFKSEDCPQNGVLGIHGHNLVIMTVDQLDNDTLYDSVSLRYTPKDMANCIDSHNTVYVVEADFNIETPYNEFEETEISNNQVSNLPGIDEEAQEYFQQFGYPRKSESSNWGSCIQCITSNSENGHKEIIQTIEFVNNEVVFKIEQVNFSDSNSYIVVSSAINQTFNPISNKETYLTIYKITQEDGTLTFVHKTKTDSLALALHSFQEKLLVGCGNQLILYDLGKKQLLKKASSIIKSINQIVDIKSQGFRVMVGDIRDSITAVVYKPLESVFIPFADDIVQRHVTRSSMLDYDTVIGGDKFGSIWVLRIPKDVSKLSDEDNHGLLLQSSEGVLNGSPYRLDNLVNFYIQDIPTGFSKGSLTIGGSECILYTGLQGTIGCLHPMVTKSEIEFFKALQKLISSEIIDDISLTNRDFTKYRGYYVPMKNVIDGDLIETYYKLNGEKRVRIAEKMDRLPREIDRRISDIRNRVAY